ncbi:MAG: ubiquitin-binding protein cue5 [Bogoriella megaspora]|nr:MAG: ubiquitin-binding protein cue5 [Bogoriella megaspora]
MADHESSEKVADITAMLSSYKTGAESPTTAREPDWDDEETHDSGLAAENTSKANTAASQAPTTSLEAPPAKPPRPLSPQAQAEATLIEAFPDMDTKVIKAVLAASGGRVEPAFNALLGMSDPNFKAEEELPPAQPPRPTQPRSQLEADELYARQLNEHYNAARYQQRPGQERGPPLPRRQQSQPYDDEGDQSPSFFDEELPKIQENIRKGFQDTQRTVNRWISDFKKRIDGEEEDDDIPARTGTQERQNFGSSTSDQLYGIQKNAGRARRSGDRERYDADPHVLGDDFTQLELRDDEDQPPPQPPRSNRPLANPDLFKSTPPAPQGGPVDEVDNALYRQPTPTNRQPSPGAKPGSKWQPLTSVAPNPEPEDNDPFSVGDSDDEHDTTVKKQDLRAEDTERLKKAAAESSVGDTASKTELKPAERTGSVAQKDAEAEKLISPK